MSMPEKYFSTNQLCERYGGVTKRCILKWRDEKGFPLPAFTGRIALYSADAVYAWEKMNFRNDSVAA
ncbi:hypothetical protein [Shewanella sp.]|uniref:hypothetical protein n=1 Tax=Shewanella sp. TaxID=50422 RepID=UPI003F3B2275